MLRHNLLILYRNFRRFKSTFFINLTGLSTGLACALLIYLWVNDEWLMDKFHEKDDQIYQVLEHRQQADGVKTFESTSAPLAETIIREYPEIEYTSPVTVPQKSTLSADDRQVKASGMAAGQDYFNIFSYELLQGDRNHVLQAKNSIVISESLALKLFGTTESIIGKGVMVDHSQQHFVSGIIRDVPDRSSLKFDYVFSFEGYREGKDHLLYWGNTNVRTVMLLKKGTDIAAVNAKIADYVQRHTDNTVTHRTMFVKRYSEKYLYGKYENGVLTGGRITYVKLFSAIAVFILVIACINFMNLSTAKASRRIREVGIKKAIGAGRHTLILQYMGESMTLSGLSLLVALLMIDLLLPQFNLITGKNLALSFEPFVVLSATGIAVTTGLLAGSYPALYLSGFHPALILKGKLNTSAGEVWTRKGLVMFQFILSVIFIISVIVVYKQIEFIQSKDLGYSRDNIIQIAREGPLWQPEKLETFLSEIRNIPGIVNASSVGHNMIGHNSGTYGIEWPGKNASEKMEFENFAVNYGMMETLGIQIARGRVFSKAFGADTSRIIFNEAAIAFMGLTDPIGKTVKLWGHDMEIIGVAKDFHFETLHESVKPAFFWYAPRNTYLISAKLFRGTEKETLDRLRTFYEKYNAPFSFDFKFLDDAHQDQYIAEQRVATLSRYFAVLAILISCLGLFGLAAFTGERRLKEIGIRKVLGSSVGEIVVLLSGELTKTVVLSIIIAAPLGYFITSYWLDTFAFRIKMEWWYYAGAGLLAVLIAWSTVAIQALKAARISPTQSLKIE